MINLKKYGIGLNVDDIEHAKWILPDGTILDTGDHGETLREIYGNNDYFGNLKKVFSQGIARFSMVQGGIYFESHNINDRQLRILYKILKFYPDYDFGWQIGDKYDSGFKSLALYHNQVK